jgi:hypothetical protein
MFSGVKTPATARLRKGPAEVLFTFSHFAMGIDVTPRGWHTSPKESNASVVDMILPFDLRRSAESAARADLKRRLRANEGMSALLDILDSTDDRPKANVHELRPPGAGAGLKATLALPSRAG